MKYLVILFSIFFLTTVACAGTTDVVFQWDTNDETDLAGYRLYQSDTPGGQVIDGDSWVFEVLLSNPAFDHTGDTAEWTAYGVPDGTWYWVLTAFDNQVPENESGRSNEVFDTFDTTAPGAPQQVIMKEKFKIE